MMSEDLDIQVHSVSLQGKEYFLEEVLGGDSTPLRNFYIINAFNNRVWIKTTSREKAQEIVDAYYGQNFYLVKSIKGAKGSEKVSVRATEFRKNQVQQRAKSRLLYG